MNNRIKHLATVFTIIVKNYTARCHLKLGSEFPAIGNSFSRIHYMTCSIVLQTKNTEIFSTNRDGFR
uniref:Uncharacterized protein n=1 Tax=Lepeophtheirus salmonis TaxID=72036 RepID=A0A0K2SZ80_LEPSM